MIKKLFLLLLFSANMYAVEPIGVDSYRNNLSSYDGIEPWATFLVCITLPNIIKSSSEWDEKTKKKILPIIYSLTIGAGIAMGVYTVIVFYSIAKDIYDYNYPSEAKLALLAAAREQLKYLKAEKELRDCFLGNMRVPRNNAGIPTVCEELANAFAAVANQAQFQEMLTRFKNCSRV